MKQNEDGKTVQGTDVLFPAIGEIIGIQVFTGDISRDGIYTVLLANHHLSFRRVRIIGIIFAVLKERFGGHVAFFSGIGTCDSIFNRRIDIQREIDVLVRLVP